MKKVKLGSPIFANPFHIEMPLAATQTFYRRSGHFVTISGGNISVANDPSAILGWALVGKDWISSGTAAADKVTVCVDPYKVWEVPARDTFTVAQLKGLIGDACDLEQNGDGIQCVDWAEYSKEVLIVVGGDVDEQTLYVHMNPLKLFAVTSA